MKRALFAIVLVAGCGASNPPAPHNATPPAPALDPTASAAVREDGVCTVEGRGARGWMVNHVIVDRTQIVGLCKLGHDTTLYDNTDATPEQWHQLEAELTAAGVTYKTDQVLDLHMTECMNNPLAKDCM